MCILCSKRSIQNICGACFNRVSLEIERLQRAGNNKKYQTTCHLTQMLAFDTKIACAGDANTVVSWDIIDKITNGALEHG